MTWAAFQSTLLLALAGLVPAAIYWLKLWMNGRIAELQAKSAENTGRIDQHDKIEGVVTTATGGMNVAPSVSSTTRSIPITLSSDALHETPDTGTMTEVTDALKASRPRVGQVDPHNLASAVIEAQAGIPKP